MSRKVLFVDDEPNVLQSIKRNLHKKFDVDTADSGDEALRLMAANGSYAIIVSDMRMPGMNGVELLKAAKEQFPDTVRMMLTGNADQQTAVDAVNHGDIFRFLNKPCNTDELAGAVSSGLRQHELITAEKELLENTLRGSIRALSDILSLANPELFGRTTRLKSRMRMLAENMQLDNVWELESAAMLAQIGCITVEEALVHRRATNEDLAYDEMSQFAAHANVGAELLAAIPRMDSVAESIRYQEKHFDGSGFPKDGVKGKDIPLGARLLKIVLDFDAIDSSGLNTVEAVDMLKSQSERYDPDILTIFAEALGNLAALSETRVEIAKLTDTMTLAEDVRTGDDLLLISKGQEMTLSARRHLQKFMDRGLIGDTVLVWLPAE